MAKYLIEGNYLGDGAQGLLQEGGSSRREMVEQLVTMAGGTVESFYYAFGDTDLYVIVEMPDNATVAGLSIMVNATGATTSKITVLLTAEEIDTATKVSATYRPPGS